MAENRYKLFLVAIFNDDSISLFEITLEDWFGITHQDYILVVSESRMLVVSCSDDSECFNGGVCDRGAEGNREYRFCTCPTGFTGRQCEVSNKWSCPYTKVNARYWF